MRPRARRLTLRRGLVDLQGQRGMVVTMAGILTL